MTIIRAGRVQKPLRRVARLSLPGGRCAAAEMVCLVRRGHAAPLCVPPLRQTAGAGAGAEPTGNLHPALGRPQSGFGWGALSCPWWRPGRRAHPEGPRDFWFPNLSCRSPRPAELRCRCRRWFLTRVWHSSSRPPADPRERKCCYRSRCSPVGSGGAVPFQERS